MKAKVSKVYRLFKEFGSIFAIKWLFFKITKQHNKYIDLIYNYLCKFLSDDINEFNNKEFNNKEKLKNYVWICWWQGYEAMPDFCKMCYKQLKSVLNNDYNLILIDKNNYKEYASIPDYIIEKVNSNKIPFTQLSDILRQSLLLENGGTWIDASIWCTDKINKYLDNKNDFWSVKLKTIDDETVWGQLISECKWSSFLLNGNVGCPIFDFVFTGMCKYFNNHDFLIDYFLQNLLIKIAYDNIPIIKTMIDDVPESNECIYELYKVMDTAYDQSKWEKLTSNTAFFKLTQKRKYVDFCNGKPTFYKYLIESAGKNNG